MASAAGRVSVVVPTHDTRELTLSCLASLRAAPGAWELVVVDDGSRDGTAEAVRQRHPEVRLLRFESARGFSAAANAGLRSVRGGLLWLLNSDTEVPSDSFERLEAAFDRDPKLGAGGAQLLNPDGSRQWSGGPFPRPSWLFWMASGLPALLSRRPRSRVYAGLRERLRRVEWVTGAALALRRAAWEQVGPLDESFRFYAQDLDYCLRLRAAGWAVGVIEALRVRHVGGATIGRAADAAASWHPGLLWTDFVRCIRKAQGQREARNAAAALRAGARVRLAARAVAETLRPAARGGEWQRESRALRLGLEALEGCAE